MNKAYDNSRVNACIAAIDEAIKVLPGAGQKGFDTCVGLQNAADYLGALIKQLYKNQAFLEAQYNGLLESCECLESQLGAMKEIPDDLVEILTDVLLEVERAEGKHPEWPRDAIHAAAIVAEESGELVRASLWFMYEGAEIRPAKTEAIQVACTAIRFLKNLQHYDNAKQG